ncbi:MAG: hypothetical protein RIR90_628 [Bacteroidota bacterium]|jgi:phospholipid/cholesterol/gamma-HCH transport system substrate-binding protein
MKISNETKVGALTAIAITLLVLGFNFLKGRSLFKTGHFLYAKYPDAKGLMVSNPVYVNGFQIGSVYDIETESADLKKINVSIKLKDDYEIPVNSVASIIKDPLGTPSIEIALGNDQKHLKSGDTLMTRESMGILGAVANQLLPVADQIKETVRQLDIVLKNVNSIFDPTTKGNLQEVIANLNKTTANLMNASASMQGMLNEQTGSITKTMNNVNSFTKNLADNNEKINGVVTNLQTTTDKLAKSDINGTIADLKTSVNNLNNILTKIDKGEGALGKLMNDKALYDNLNNTIRSANILVDDLRMHPKRYVNVSVFGKKDKSGPLMQPLADSSKQKQ